VVHYLFKGFP